MLMFYKNVGASEKLDTYHQLKKSDPHLPFAEATRALGGCFGVTGSQILPRLSGIRLSCSHADTS
jgi:hypothetical protein